MRSGVLRADCPGQWTLREPCAYAQYPHKRKRESFRGLHDQAIAELKQGHFLFDTGASTGCAAGNPNFWIFLEIKTNIKSKLSGKKSKKL